MATNPVSQHRPEGSKFLALFAEWEQPVTFSSSKTVDSSKVERKIVKKIIHTEETNPAKARTQYAKEFHEIRPSYKLILLSVFRDKLPNIKEVKNGYTTAQ